MSKATTTTSAATAAGLTRFSQIVTGKTPSPPRILLYGTEGIGKSTFANTAPSPIFIPVEDGLGRIDCAHFPPAESFAEVEQSLNEIGAEQHDYHMVVVDSVDALERLIWTATSERCGSHNIEDVGGGYSKGYTQALMEWQRFVRALDMLRIYKGMGIILIAHCKIEKFEDPESAAYDRYSPKLNKHASGLLTEWADAVLFATRRVRVSAEDRGFGRKRNVAAPIGADGGERILRCIGGPACVAKNRYGMPAELPLDWEEVEKYLL